MGKNTRATRKLLDAVFAKQYEAREAVGHVLDVDVFDVMVGGGLEVVHAGL